MRGVWRNECSNASFFTYIEYPSCSSTSTPESLSPLLLHIKISSYPICLPQSHEHVFSKILKANSRQQSSLSAGQRGCEAQQCAVRPLASQPHLRRVTYAPSTTRIPSSTAAHGFVSLSWENIFVVDDATVSRWRRSRFFLALSTAQQWAYLM